MEKPRDFIVTPGDLPPGVRYMPMGQYGPAGRISVTAAPADGPQAGEDLVMHRGPLQPADFGPMFYDGPRRLAPSALVRMWVPVPRTRAAWRDYYKWAAVSAAYGTTLCIGER